MLSAIIFDFDGVIVDSEPLHYEAFARVARPLGFDIDYATYLRDYIGFDDRGVFEELFSQADQPLGSQRLRELIARKGEAFQQILREGIEPCPGAIEMITHAAARLPLAICSGALRSDIDAILPAIGNGRLGECFGAVVTADDVERSKPDPTSYRLAAERLGIDPGQCLAIEDTPAGLASAQRAGLHTLAVCTTHDADALTLAEQIVDSLTDISVDDLLKMYNG
jgi:beta-phosphoglucomutase